MSDVAGYLVMHDIEDVSGNVTTGYDFGEMMTLAGAGRERERQQAHADIDFRFDPVVRLTYWTAEVRRVSAA